MHIMDTMRCLDQDAASYHIWTLFADMDAGADVAELERMM